MMTSIEKPDRQKLKKTRFSEHELRQARAVNLPAYLNISESAARCIPSPFRADTHPSFSIFRGREGRWIGHDIATGETYDAISIASAVGHLGFQATIRAILFFLSQHSQAETENDIAKYGLPREKPAQAILEGHAPTKTEPIRYEWKKDNRSALDYLQDVRGISRDVISAIRQRIKLVAIKNAKISIRCIALENSNSGYNCRAINGWKFEHVIGRQGLTVFDFAGDRGKNDVWVFEAVIDALSFATLFPANSGQLISLNSTANLSLLINSDNFSSKHVFFCFDRDIAGIKATDKALELLRGKCLSAIDARHFVEAGKDINDTLLFKRFELEKEEKSEEE